MGDRRKEDFDQERFSIGALHRSRLWNQLQPITRFIAKGTDPLRLNLIQYHRFAQTICNPQNLSARSIAQLNEVVFPA